MSALTDKIKKEIAEKIFTANIDKTVLAEIMTSIATLAEAATPVTPNYKAYTTNIIADYVSATSGLLVIGKQYSIDDFQVGDDFVNVGGANVVGTIFIATGTTPTVWSNSSTLSAVNITNEELSTTFEDDITFEFDLETYRLIILSAGDEFTEGKCWVNLPNQTNQLAGTNWERLGDGAITVENIGSLGGLRKSIKIEVYN